MLYAWPVTMTGSGLRRAAAELLGLLASFEATQLAGFGPAGIHLVAACLAMGNDHYSGLAVRPEQKQYGSNRQIDPPGDRRRKVVLVDDSISSGTSFFKAAQILERNGYEVEGTVCLVDFSYRGGRERAQARGYKVKSLFDMWKDIKSGWRASAGLPRFGPAGLVSNERPRGLPSSRRSPAGSRALYTDGGGPPSSR